MSIFRSISSLALLLLPGLAHAQGISAPVVGTGRSSAATADPTAAYFNPAMSAFVGKAQLMLGGYLVLGDVGYEREYRAVYQRADSLDFALPIPADSVTADKRGFQGAVGSTPFAGAPNLFLALPFAGKKLTFGFGTYVPYAAIVSYPEDGPQRFQLRRAFIAATQFTPTISWRPHPRVAIGAGVSYVLGYAELSRVQDFATLQDLGTALEGLEQTNDFGPEAPPGVRELDVMARPIALRGLWAHGVTFNAGFAVEPVDGFTIGASYQHSFDLEYNGSFELDMDDDFFTQDLASQGLAYPRRVRGDAELSVPFPNAIRVGLRWAPWSSFAVGVDGVYTFWSRVRSYDVVVRSDALAQPEVGLGSDSSIRLVRNWKNTVGVDVFGEVRVAKSATVYGRLGFSQGAVPDETVDASSPDGDRLRVIGGVTFDISEGVTLLGELGVQTIFERTVAASEFDLGNGTYTLTLGHGGVSLFFAL